MLILRQLTAFESPAHSRCHPVVNKVVDKVVNRVADRVLADQALVDLDKTVDKVGEGCG